MNCNYLFKEQCALHNCSCEDMDCDIKKTSRLLDFQNDLKQGLTIEEACEKHNLTLGYAFKHMKQASKKQPINKYRKKHYGNYERRYITETHGVYYVRKFVKGRYKAFGSFSNLEDAKTMRDYFEKHGWHSTKIDEYCKKAGVIRRQRGK